MEKEEKPIFRQAALDHLSSPEHLDHLIHVVTPRGRVTLCCLLLFCFSLLAWAFFGSIPNRVTGVGIFMDYQHLRSLQAPASGVATKVAISPGDYIKKRDFIVRISDIEHKEKLLAEKKRVGSLKIELMMLKKLLTEQHISSSQMDIVDKVLIKRKELELLDLQVSLDVLKKLPSEYRVLSPYAGLVVQSYITQNQSIHKGIPLAYIQEEAGEKNTETSEFYCFFDASIADLIKKNMPALVHPWGVEPELAGELKGHVASISYLPATKLLFQSAHISPDLFSTLLKDQLMIPVSIKPELSEDSKTGYAWTKKAGGPDHAIPLGTLCTVSITLSEKRPIAYIFPYFEEI